MTAGHSSDEASLENTHNKDTTYSTIIIIIMIIIIVFTYSECIKLKSLICFKLHTNLATIS